MTPPLSAPRGTRGSPEKRVERAGDELMALFGFTAIRFSQARATMQTRGIPDRRYYKARGSVHYWTSNNGGPFFLDEKTLGPAGPFVVWWEAKAATKQSVHQKAFQELVQSCCETYLVGGVDQLEQYLITVGLARRVPGGIEGVRRSA